MDDVAGRVERHDHHEGGLQQLARQLFKTSLVDIAVSAERVAGVLEYVEKHQPAHAMQVLKTYQRLVAQEVARSQAVVEHAGQVSAAIFGVIGIGGTIWGWWKNQNITSASLAGQQLVDALKKEGVVNGITAAKSAALSAASAVAKTTAAASADTADTTGETVSDSADLNPGGNL